MPHEIVHVVAHTHWDREWYQPFSQFRYRLVRMVDELLDRLENDDPDEGGHFAHFHLDGQTVVLEDYLSLRPERKELLGRLISSGRLLVGPWYAQPDETLVTGESLIRNLMIGMEQAEEFGETMKVGYVPDIFGHIGQLPQILRGLGIDNALLWRGMVPPPAEKPTTEFNWLSPSGDRVLGLFLSTSGYFTAPQIDQAAGVPTIVEELRRKSASSHLLLMNGADHHHMQRDLPRALEEMNKDLPEAELRLSTLPAYVEAVAAELGDGASLHTVTGELRETRRSPEGLFLLYGTLSARMPIKQANFEAERLLIRVVEPLLASSDAEVDAQLWERQLWTTLLKNHAHDTICGCSADTVLLDTEARFREVRQTASILIRDLLRAREGEPSDYAARAGKTLTSKAQTGEALALNEARTGGATSAFRTSPMREIPFLLHNCAGVENRAVAIVELALPEDLPPQPFIRAAQGEPHRFAIRNPGGALSPVQFIGFGESRSVETEERRFPTFTDRRSVRIAFKPETPLPPLSNDLFVLTEAKEMEAVEARSSMESPLAERESDRIVLRTPSTCLQIREDGGVELSAGDESWKIEELLTLWDGGDIGDLYNYSPPEHDREISSKEGVDPHIELVVGGPLYAEAKLSMKLQLPAEARADRKGRSSSLETLPVSVRFTVTAGSETIGVAVDFENRVKDHRLRAQVNLGTHADSSAAQAAFCVESRPAVAPPVPVHLWREDAPNTHPFHGWCAPDSTAGGVAVLSRGLPEYQLLPGSEGENSTICVTLLRSVGRVHARDSLTIDRRAWGIPFRTPLAQCLGPHHYELGILPFKESWDRARVDEAAEAFVHQYEAFQLPEGSEVIGAGAGTSGPLRRVEGDGVIVSSIKRENNGSATILRLWNNRAEKVASRLHLARAISKVARTDLREKSTEALSLDRAGTLEVELRPWEILTLRVE